jgi:hypothetical protein
MSPIPNASGASVPAVRTTPFAALGRCGDTADVSTTPEQTPLSPAAPPAAPPPAAAGRGRLILARLLTIVGVLLLVVSLLSNFVKREALDSANVEATAQELIADPTIRDQLAASMVDTLYANVDVTQELQAKLPENLQALAGPIAGLTREVSDRAAQRLLERPRVQTVFVTAVGVSHQQLVKVLEGDTRAVETTNGQVVLDIQPLVVALGERFQIANNLVQQIPSNKARIVLLDSDELGLAQDITHWLEVVADWIWVLALAAWAAAVWLARGRRRIEIRAIAAGFVIAGFLVVVIRGLAGGYIVDQLAATDSVKPAVQDAWNIITDSLAAAGWTVLIVGVLALLGVWFMGPGRRAHRWRQALAPYLRRADVSYGVLALLFLLFVWWTPLITARNVIILGVLAVIGFEVVRRQTQREFPDAVAAEDLWDTIRGRFR